ncbi:hypothetical protein EV175_006222 [Coemansia sp. RSA 1933]|nr:hypothetical protein EV175_006222 [Coemansia sp. RSA 1933]
MVSAEQLEQKLKDSLPAEAVVRVVDKSGGCGSSFELFIISDAFNKLTLLKRHRNIHDILEDEMPVIHALTMKLYTVAQYDKIKEKEAEVEAVAEVDTDKAANQVGPEENASQ